MRSMIDGDPVHFIRSFVYSFILIRLFALFCVHLNKLDTKVASAERAPSVVKASSSKKKINQKVSIRHFFVTVVSFFYLFADRTVRMCVCER